MLNDTNIFCKLCTSEFILFNHMPFYHQSSSINVELSLLYFIYFCPLSLSIIISQIPSHGIPIFSTSSFIPSCHVCLESLPILSTLHFRFIHSSYLPTSTYSQNHLSQSFHYFIVSGLYLQLLPILFLVLPSYLFQERHFLTIYSMIILYIYIILLFSSLS